MVSPKEKTRREIHSQAPNSLPGALPLYLHYQDHCGFVTSVNVTFGSITKSMVEEAERRVLSPAVRDAEVLGKPELTRDGDRM